MRKIKYPRAVDPLGVGPQQDDSTLAENNHQDEPRIRFWQAIVLQALIDVTNKNQKISQEAKTFFEDPESNLEDTCELAHLDTKWVKKIYQKTLTDKIKFSKAFWKLKRNLNAIG